MTILFSESDTRHPHQNPQPKGGTVHSNKQLKSLFINPFLHSASYPFVFVNCKKLSMK